MKIPLNAVIAYDLSVLLGEVFLPTHPTNPLLLSETIDPAVAAGIAAA